MSGFCIEVMIDSSRVSNKYRQQYEEYFLNASYAHIIETPEVSWRINKGHNSRISKLQEQKFKPPKPQGANAMI